MPRHHHLPSAHRLPLKKGTSLPSPYALTRAYVQAEDHIACRMGAAAQDTLPSSRPPSILATETQVMYARLPSPSLASAHGQIGHMN